MTRQSYLDTGVLITAWRGLGSAGLTALEMLDDPGLLLVVSDAVWLELLPKPLHEKRRDEIEFYQAVFDRAERLPWSLDVLHLAQGLARQHGIAAMDAIHAGFAVAHSVDEIVTTERPEKPLFRIEQLKVRSLPFNVNLTRVVVPSGWRRPRHRRQPGAIRIEARALRHSGR